jgi:hypothetical protein
MLNLIISLIAIPLIPVIIEDFRHRHISIVWLVFFVVCTLIYQLNTSISFSEFVVNSVINFLFILVHYIILTAYFSIKDKKIVDLKKKYLGAGDIFFLISVSFLFSPVNFICFFLLSLVFSLLFTAVGKLFMPGKLVTIPLAGLQALFLIFILIFTFFGNKKVDINNDQFMIKLLTEYAGIN